MLTDLTNHLNQLFSLNPELNLLWAFLAGLVSSLTPCVYPLIPVTLAIFGAAGETSRWRAFCLSLTYVLGIALTYSTLGLVSAKTGMIFGSFLGNPWVVGVVIIFLFFLLLFTLEIVQFSLAYTVQTKASTIRGKGKFGAFLMGAASGFVAAPCIGPVLVVILGIAGASGNAVTGGLLLFFYSLGLGLPFLILGTYSGLLTKLPRSGNWLRTVKVIIAISLFAVSLLLLQSFFDSLFVTLQSYVLTFWGWLVLVGGLALLWWAVPRDRKALILLGVVLTGSVLYLSFIPAPQLVLNQPEEGRVIEVHSLDEPRARARREGRILMIDIFAEWCAACKELEALTFPKSEVVTQLKRLVPVRIDYSNEKVSEELTEKYNILGLPTILFIRPDGSEVPHSRVTGFMASDKFAAHIDGLLSER